MSVNATISDELDDSGMDDDYHEIHGPPMVPKPSTPKCRKPIKSESFARNYYSNSFERLHMMHETRRRRNRSAQQSDDELSSSDENLDHDSQITDNSDVFMLSQRNASSDKRLEYRRNLQTSYTERSPNNVFMQLVSMKKYLIVMFVVILALTVVNSMKRDTKKQQTDIEFDSMDTESDSDRLLESIEQIKTRFYNQESYIWNDISSGIHEVISRNPKIPSIIVLFANESTTMDCLALAIAHMSSTILGTNNPLILNPEDFKNNAGEVINELNELIPAKKAVVIRDILNINAEAMKAFHNLCDRINPLVAEAIYIITMKTKNYQPSQKKLDFVEEQIYDKLSKDIDEDTLLALVTRITDGAIILVQPEPNLRYC